MFKKKMMMFIICFTSAFSFSINELEFDKELKKNQVISKKFSIENNTLEDRHYIFSIEGDDSVRVTPKIIKLSKLKSRDIEVTVKGDKKLGEHKYFLVIQEKVDLKDKEGLGINKKIKIEQKYKIIK